MYVCSTKVEKLYKSNFCFKIFNIKNITYNLKFRTTYNFSIQQEVYPVLKVQINWLCASREVCKNQYRPVTQNGNKQLKKNSYKMRDDGNLQFIFKKMEFFLRGDAFFQFCVKLEYAEWRCINRKYETVTYVSLQMSCRSIYINLRFKLTF